MDTRSFQLDFIGSFSDRQRDAFPHSSGIYLVYRGVWSEKERLFFCHEIIYIGQATNLYERHHDHEKHDLFLSQCRPGEIVFYSYALAPQEQLDQIESALIYHTRPILNINSALCFTFGPTRVFSSGACALLDTDIFVSNEP